MYCCGDFGGVAQMYAFIFFQKSSYFCWNYNVLMDTIKDFLPNFTHNSQSRARVSQFALVGEGCKMMGNRSPPRLQTAATVAEVRFFLRPNCSQALPKEKKKPTEKQEDSKLPQRTTTEKERRYQKAAETRMYV